MPKTESWRPGLPSASAPYEGALAALADRLEVVDDETSEWSRSYLRYAGRRYLDDLATVSRLHRGGEILEVGSLPCHLTYLLAQQGYTVVGLDVAPERASHFIADNDLCVVKCNVEAERLPFEDDRFGLVMFSELFEHLRIDPLATLEELFRVTRPGGTLVLSTPNLYATPTTLRFLRGRGFNDPVDAYKKLRTLGHPGHVRLYSAAEIKLFLVEAGFTCREVSFFTPRPYKGRAAIVFNPLDRLVPKWRRYQRHIATKG